MGFLSDPRAIEARSREIIAARVGDLGLEPGARAIVTRIIHATGDLSYASLVAVHPGVVAAATAALRQGADIITDVEMVRNGVSSHLVSRGGGRVLCAIREAEVIKTATARGETRAMVAMEYLAPRMDGAIVAIGNAPTALFRLLELVAGGRAAPAAIVGTPVGFVGAAEAKAALETTGIPYVTVRGPKGGSTVAVAAVNALLHLAWDEEE
ncbi:precorrin isomerase [Moorella thermoacetica]|uniref:Cobalt-precorrin-8 methylmutase n=3 Tax=Neomoorella thermoacetica TaxID=1525 RepID=A0A1D7XA36_NEOTH|nr:precorrin-8X methylmutase [Moorella thermoacetica]AKX96501.1 precorrin-8X methylmutase [Moorella thermoacetica]AOQ23778.1 Precorrin-8X methylmutase [Moorella thermoacetica]APC08237.1 precorrin-8X methylmutase [Moorella thermoacetica]OIQ08877.1 precorrin-8X methylmutase [Moorella thermoacetica]OIQ12751.1 precorrin-8X methylmutase [Moorella thermoacetica]